jgi:hypothetical protein
MKKIIIISITAIVLLSSCQKHTRIHPCGSLVSHTFTNPNITGISLFDMSGDLYIYISEEAEEDTLIISVDRNVYPFIRKGFSGAGTSSEKTNYTINLHYSNVTFMARKPNLTISLIVRDLNHIGLSGASFANIDGTLVSGDLKIHLSGASTLRGHIDANKISAELSGASRMDLSGYCETFNLTLSGASKTFGYGMVCNDLTANFSGASRAELTVLETISATLSGASSLRYDGNPRILRNNLSGASSLQRR